MPSEKAPYMPTLCLTKSFDLMAVVVFAAAHVFEYKILKEHCEAVCESTVCGTAVQ